MAKHRETKGEKKHKETKGEKKMHKVMHEYKEGKLKSSSGQKVTNRKQAIAIAMSEKERASKRGRKKKKG